jgi:hypothetical protein
MDRRRLISGMIFLILWTLFWSTILAYAFRTMDLGR